MDKRVNEAAKALKRELKAEILSSDGEGIFLRIRIENTYADIKLTMFGPVLGWGVPQHTNHLSDFQRSMLREAVESVIERYK